MNLEELAEQLSMTELIRLQDGLSRAIARRFEKRLALVFCDMVGSTRYFVRHGDEAGRALQQRHVDLVGAAIAGSDGRVVDTAGDGVFLCFGGATAATRAMEGLQRAIARDNDARSIEHRLHVRMGVHVGPVLTDGVQVSGEAVNFCSHVAGSADAQEIRLSQAAHAELTDAELRLRCSHLQAAALKGVTGPQELYCLDWRDAGVFPTLVRLQDGTVIRLPMKEVIRFGRLGEQHGESANDIVINPADPELASRVSRWHFELHLHAAGFMLRSVTTSTTTEVDGRVVKEGESVLVRPSARVRLGGAVTLEFASEDFSQEITRLPG